MDLKKFSVKMADVIADFIGSWTFIIILSIFLIIWVVANVTVVNWDPYPFILMNLFLSFQAAYATPLILMSANRQAERDRKHMLKDLKIDQEDHEIIKDLHKIIKELHYDIKLDKQAIKNQVKLKTDHQELKTALDEIKELLKMRS